jgi:hypothetical protein
MVKPKKCQLFLSGCSCITLIHSQMYEFMSNFPPALKLRWTGPPFVKPTTDKSAFIKASVYKFASTKAHMGKSILTQPTLSLLLVSFAHHLGEGSQT